MKTRLKHLLRRLLYLGRGRFCPVCGSHSRAFLPTGVDRRADARCPACGSVERHRLVVRFFRERTDLFDGRPKRVLHVAPEPVLGPLIAAAVGDGYLSADLHDPSAMERMDVTDVRHPDATFDVIYCSHVLEHVPDDRRAMREFRRVLKPGGWAVLNVPVTADATVEDPAVTDPAERLRRFGQEDHVRRYGPDYERRLTDAGFRVARVGPADLFTPEERVTCGVPAGGTTGDVYHCEPA